MATVPRSWGRRPRVPSGGNSTDSGNDVKASRDVSAIRATRDGLLDLFPNPPEFWRTFEDDLA
jgi:hypothetical protein